MIQFFFRAPYRTIHRNVTARFRCATGIAPLMLTFLSEAIDDLLQQKTQDARRLTVRKVSSYSLKLYQVLLGQSIEAGNVVNATSSMQPSELNGQMYKLSTIV